MKQASAPSRSRHLLTAHADNTDDLLQRLSSNPDQGLSSSDVSDRQGTFGPNVLAQEPAEPIWKRVVAQFTDLVVWILIVAALLSGAMGEWIDTAAILAIVLLNGLIGFFQQERAERSLAALRRMSAPVAKVLRDGSWRKVAARELVPGDVVEVEAGDHIPADARLLTSYGLRVQEAALTGESEPVDKDARLQFAAETDLADRRNMIYLGTVATTGKALAVVTEIGMHTELGHIAGLLQRFENEPTPLQRRLEALGKILIVTCLGIVALIFVLQLARGGALMEVLLLAISLGVAAVPEGLPAVVTIALALGLQRMVKRNALIRKLPSVETLGSVTVICSDKTGTLTRNEMTVRRIVAGPDEFYVTGAGYEPVGAFTKQSANRAEFPVGAQPASHASPVDPAQEHDLRQVLRIGAWCNNSSLIQSPDQAAPWQVIGDPTEGALLVAARKAGFDRDAEPGRIVYQFPFDSDRKRMSVVVESPDGDAVLYTKGAPEVVLSLCSHELCAEGTRVLSEARREAIAQQNSAFAAQALRVLAVAYSPEPKQDDGEYQESELIFAGLVGMIDPPREEVKSAVNECYTAGIRPVMITGDHPQTALAVGRELGLADSASGVMVGQELSAISDNELEEKVDRISVYARVSAEHKLRVVNAWKRRGEVVAMTGDGVNDAPAIKAADIGIAMGITGTDVTKEASDMVLLDDNFASIVHAVEEGRAILDNVQKVLIFLLSCNFGEILLMLAASLLGWPAPLIPLQLLWVNLITDGLPALALGLEPPEPAIMRRKPRPLNDSIISVRIGYLIGLQGFLVGGVALGAFAYFYLEDPENLARARTAGFSALVFAELLRTFAARSQTLTVFQLGWFTNPYVILAILLSAALQVIVLTVPTLNTPFQVAPPESSDWAIVLGLALIPVSVIEIAKWGRLFTFSPAHRED